MVKVLKHIGQKNNDMDIAIITAGVLPVPAVQGGAVENLIDFCLEYNKKHRMHNITVYSIYHPRLKTLHISSKDCNQYVFINTNNWLARIEKWLYLKIHGGDEYYHYSIEFFLDKALKDIKKRHYDIIIVENRPAFSLKLKEKNSSIFVLHQGNDFLNIEVQNYKTIYDSYHRIINTSAYITERVKTIYPDDSKCRTVLNGIDTKRFYDATAINRKVVGLSHNDFVIVYSGRLTPEKGILELILALKRINKIRNIKLLIIGASAYGEDKRPTRYIKKLQEESKTINNIVTYTGFVDYNNIPSYLKTGDIAIVPSMWEEPFGLTVVEAMAAGLPLITTRSGGIPEICEGVATIVNRDNIVENLANAILDLYHHPEKRVAMSKASLERSKMFDKETYARNFFEAIKDIHP